MQSSKAEVKLANSCPKEEVLDQVCKDLEHYVSQFSNKSFALRNLSEETRLNEKTLRRLLKKKNVPSIQTLHKLYFVLTSAVSEEEMLSLCPPLIKEQLSKLSLDQLKKETPRHYNFNHLIENDPVLGEIYALLGTRDLDITEIVYRFGQYGVDLLDKMKSLGLVKKKDKDLYCLSERQPHLDGEVLKSLGSRLVTRYVKPLNTDLEGDSFMGLYCEGLNGAGKKKWLEIDEKAFKEKMLVANDDKYKGLESMFTFHATDNLTDVAKEVSP